MIGVNRRRVMGCRPKDYFAFEAIEAGTFTPPKDMEYSLDGFSFVPITAGSVSPTVAAGKKIYWRGNLNAGGTGIGQFVPTALYKVAGNINSLFYGDNFEGVVTAKGYACLDLFKNDAYICDASELVLPFLAPPRECYERMFMNCTSLEYPPQIPATDLSNYRVCGDMFNGCTSLKEAPELPSTQLGPWTYQNMFSGCTALTTPPSILPATTLVFGCYADMFKNCINLTISPTISATTLMDRCCQEMFMGCSKLEAAPVLHATTLVSWGCYFSMFKSCANLNYVKAMFTEIPSTDCTWEWLKYVASNGTFVKNSAATWDVTGANGVPSGWTIEYADE